MKCNINPGEIRYLMLCQIFFPLVFPLLRLLPNLRFQKFYALGSNVQSREGHFEFTLKFHTALASLKFNFGVKFRIRQSEFGLFSEASCNFLPCSKARQKAGPGPAFWADPRVAATVAQICVWLWQPCLCHWPQLGRDWLELTTGTAAPNGSFWDFFQRKFPLGFIPERDRVNPILPVISHRRQRQLMLSKRVISQVKGWALIDDWNESYFFPFFRVTLTSETIAHYIDIENWVEKKSWTNFSGLGQIRKKNRSHFCILNLKHSVSPLCFDIGEYQWTVAINIQLWFSGGSATVRLDAMVCSWNMKIQD